MSEFVFMLLKKKSGKFARSLLTDHGSRCQRLDYKSWCKHEATDRNRMTFPIIVTSVFLKVFLIRFASNQSGKSIAQNASTGSSAQSSMSSLVRFRTSIIEIVQIHMALIYYNHNGYMY